MKYNFDDEFVKSNRKSFDSNKKKKTDLNEDFDNVAKRKKKIAFKNYLHRLDTGIDDEYF
jgi:hypothetical protein